MHGAANDVVKDISKENLSIASDYYMMLLEFMQRNDFALTVLRLSLHLVR